MATGDVNDQLNRLKSTLPPWFGDTNPILTALLKAAATALAFVYGLVVYARLQTRIMTATGGWLDLIAQDFFGPEVSRAPGESDTSFRNEVVVNLFRERGTRRAIATVLTDLTGIEPEIFEPNRLQDTGAYNSPTIGYSVAGGYGSLLLPYQAFVTAYRPATSGIPNVAGYGISTGGYSTPSEAEYTSVSMVQSEVTDADIYAAVDGVKPAGTIAWVRIGNDNNQLPPPNFSLIVGNKPVVFGTATGPIVRLLGWNL